MAVSACLLGEPVRYDGRLKGDPRILAALQVKELRPLCPEVMGGLPVPRPAIELRGGDGGSVLDADARAIELLSGHDQTAAMVRGAMAARRAAGEATVAILKARSPSCGVGMTAIDGRVQPGDGVTAALLARAGLVLLTDEEVIASLYPPEG